MFNHGIADVCIGLIFIFVLYSLLATAINEFVATLFAYRHRMLEIGLEQMLDGRNFSYHWWDKVANFYLWLYYSVTKRDRAALKRKNFYSRKPVNATGIQKSDPFYLKRVKLNEKAALFTSYITDHPLYRRKSENSFWIKRPAYLSASSFSDILLDVLRPNQFGPSLLKDIESSINSNPEINTELKSILNIFIEQANGDLQRFKLLVENWYDDSMDRVSGWYKRQSNYILLIIGFILAMIFNVSTIELATKLSTDKMVREAMVKNAAAYVATHADDFQSLTKVPPTVSGALNAPASRAANGNMAPAATDPSTPVAVPQDTSLDKTRRALERIDSLYRESIEENNSMLGLGWKDYGYLQDSVNYVRSLVKYRVDSLNYMKNSVKNSSGAKAKPQKPLPPQPPGFLGKTWHVIKTTCDPRTLIGFLLTAIAISLGAPFWFDLLNKFVNIRVSGRNPEANNNKLISKTRLLNQKPDADSFG